MRFEIKMKDPKSFRLDRFHGDLKNRKQDIHVTEEIVNDVAVFYKSCDGSFLDELSTAAYTGYDIIEIQEENVAYIIGNKGSTRVNLAGKDLKKDKSLTDIEGATFLRFYATLVWKRMRWA